MKEINFFTAFTTIFLLFNLMISSFYVYAGGVTFFTHGWNPYISGTPAWLESIRNAVSESYLDGERNYGVITVAKSGTELVASCSSWDFDMSSGNSGEILIIIDWSNVADHLTGGPPAQDVAEVVIDKIISGQYNQAPLAALPLHFIGHSRGGGLVCEIARLLGEKGIVVDHLTPLDPHPLTGSDVQPVFGEVIDTPVAVYENTIFADVYLQSSEYPTGESISGAYNRIWGSLDGGYYDNSLVFANHRNIYLMYQGTVDFNDPVSNGEASMDKGERSAWFDAEESDGSQTGFEFSRIKGTTERKTEGLHENQLFDGSGTRQALVWSEAVWPNIADLQVRIDDVGPGYGTQAVSIGRIIDLRYIFLDYDSDCVVTLYTDTDRNPYNNNSLTPLADPVTHTKTGDNFTEYSVNWDTSGMDNGAEVYIYAEIIDGLRSRYFYAPTCLVFSGDTPDGDPSEGGNGGGGCFISDLMD